SRCLQWTWMATAEWANKWPLMGPFVWRAAVWRRRQTRTFVHQVRQPSGDSQLIGPLGTGLSAVPANWRSRHYLVNFRRTARQSRSAHLKKQTMPHTVLWPSDCCWDLDW